MPINFIYSEQFLGYEEKGHPESPERLKAVIEFLKKKKIDEFIAPRECTQEDLLCAHTEELIGKVRENLFFDPDTPNIKNIYRYAALSCGAAVEACRGALGGNLSVSLSRPPGHHAGKNSVGGFCYFNNMAVAVKKLIAGSGLKTAVLDIDGHHGNGTEELLKEQENVIYVSIHQFPVFPGTGNISFANCYNFPVYGGSTIKTYMEKFRKALAVIEDFSPDVLGISAGFDAHYTDPLLDLPVDDAHYYIMGKEISGLAKKIFVVLEGGYNVSTIGNAFYCLIKGLSKEWRESR